MRKININIEYLTRIEGHGSIILNATDRTIEEIQWKITETPRFFESFVRGRRWDEIAHIVSRICGICSIGHTEASLKATEKAMDIEISEQTKILRRLIKASENLQSHILHVGYLVAPDLFGVESVFPLIETHPDAVSKIISLHRLANEISDLLVGRTTHPISMVPGGFTWIPSEKQFKEIKQRLLDAIPIYDEVAQLVLDNVGSLPDFTRETEFISLAADNEYPLYDGVIGSSDGGRWPPEEYQSITNEFVVPYSTAKFTRHNRESYMVGALARFNLNRDRLSPLAKEWAKKFDLNPICHNPFMNSIAQLIECFNDAETSVAWVDQLLEMGIDQEERPKVKVKAGHGIGAVDVPRGILFHDYTYDDRGICIKANCIIPTNQNHNNINQDLKVFVPTILDKPKEEIELLLEMLVRAYDPCVSCSTHYLKVEWK